MSDNLSIISKIIFPAPPYPVLKITLPVSPHGLPVSPWPPESSCPSWLPYPTGSLCPHTAPCPPEPPFPPYLPWLDHLFHLDLLIYLDHLICLDHLGPILKSPNPLESVKPFIKPDLFIPDSQFNRSRASQYFTTDQSLPGSFRYAAKMVNFTCVHKQEFWVDTAWLLEQSLLILPWEKLACHLQLIASITPCQLYENPLFSISLQVIEFCHTMESSITRSVLRLFR